MQNEIIIETEIYFKTKSATKLMRRLDKLVLLMYSLTNMQHCKYRN